MSETKTEQKLYNKSLDSTLSNGNNQLTELMNYSPISFYTCFIKEPLDYTFFCDIFSSRQSYIHPTFSIYNCKIIHRP